MSAASSPYHDSLRFEADLVDQITYLSHTTQRNGQQCLRLWARCRLILESLSQQAGQPPDTSHDINRLRAVMSLDSLLLKGLRVMKTEAAVSAPIDDKLQTWEPNRKELRVIFELLHRQIFESYVPTQPDWLDDFEDAVKYDEMTWRSTCLTCIQRDMAESPIPYEPLVEAATKLCSESVLMWESEPDIRNLATSCLVTISLFVNAAAVNRVVDPDWTKATQIAEDVLTCASTPAPVAIESIRDRLALLTSSPVTVVGSQGQQGPSRVSSNRVAEFETQMRGEGGFSFVAGQDNPYEAGPWDAVEDELKKLEEPVPVVKGKYKPPEPSPPPSPRPNRREEDDEDEEDSPYVETDYCSCSDPECSLRRPS